MTFDTVNIMMDPDLILFNHHGESMRLSRIPIYQNQENIVIISEDGGKFLVSKFIFNFLSCFSSNETDLIMAPVSSKSLSSICQALSFNKVEDISLEDLQLLGITSNYFSTISSSSMAEKWDINNSKEEESKLIPINMINNSDEDEQNVKVAEFASLGLNETNVQDKSTNSVVSHSNISVKKTEGLQTKSKGCQQARVRPTHQDHLRKDRWQAQSPRGSEEQSQLCHPQGSHHVLCAQHHRVRR